MPTGRGLSRLRQPQNGHRQVPVTGPLSLGDNSLRPAVGVGLHLLFPAFAGTVANASLPVRKLYPDTVSQGDVSF
jgi:hypothetical protein